jgi:hypothetical protein
MLPLLLLTSRSTVEMGAACSSPIQKKDKNKMRIVVTFFLINSRDYSQESLCKWNFCYDFHQ